MAGGGIKTLESKHTLPKTNISPENQRLEDDSFPFLGGTFAHFFGVDISPFLQTLVTSPSF